MTKSTVAAGLTPRIFDTSYTSLRKGTLYSRTPLLPPPPFPNFFPLIFFSQHPLPFRVSRFAYSSPHRYIWTRPHPPPPVDYSPAYRPGAHFRRPKAPAPCSIYITPKQYIPGTETMDKWSPVALFCARVRVSDITVMSWRYKWWPGFSVSEVVVVTVVPSRGHRTGVKIFHMGSSQTTKTDTIGPATTRLPTKVKLPPLTIPTTANNSPPLLLWVSSARHRCPPLFCHLIAYLQAVYLSQFASFGQTLSGNSVN